MFAGHGSYRFGAGDTVVPEGTTLHVYSRFGETIGDSRGRAIETGGTVTPVQTFGPGSTIPNYTLRAPNRLRIHQGSTTVEDPTNLSDLLQPNMGVCHWAACTEGM
ncbi:MAG: putative adhesin [Pseudonocardiaceae bacterium]